MTTKYRPNQLAVSDKVIDDIKDFLDPEAYDGNLTQKEILEIELGNAKVPQADFTLYHEVSRLVEGGFFRVYTSDIRQFLETLNLSDHAMKQDTFETYKQVMYHAIKRYLKQ